MRQTVNGLIRQVPGLGLESVLPKVGPGNGSAHAHYWHMHRVEKYVGAAKGTKDQLLAVLKAVQAAEQKVYGNVFWIRDSDDNPNRANNYHLFFKDEASLFVFKTFMHEQPPEILHDRKGHELYLFGW